MKFFLFICGLLIQTWLVASARKKQYKYEANWYRPMKNCDDGEPTIFNFDGLKITRISIPRNVLVGTLEILNPIQDGTRACIFASKLYMNGGSEIVTRRSVTNICEYVPDLDEPHSFIFDGLNLDPRSCPIPAVVMNLTTIGTQLKNDNVGEYRIRIELYNDDGPTDPCNVDNAPNLISCFVYDMAVEKYSPQDYEE